MQKQPVIGIVPALNKNSMHPSGAEIVYARRTYTDVLKNVGVIPIILNIDMPVGAALSLCDGIVITGGEDIDPALYGQEVRVAQGFTLEPRERTEWELELLRGCEQLGVPVLGICYGMQLLNVYRGGTLTQDIPSERPWADNHWLTHHDVTFSHDYLGIKAGEVRDVESRHHQAIDQLADGFEVCATAPDGMIEAIRHKHQFGMQWHPESDLTGVHVYRAFVELCMGEVAREN